MYWNAVQCGSTTYRLALNTWWEWTSACSFYVYLSAGILTPTSWHHFLQQPYNMITQITYFCVTQPLRTNRNLTYHRQPTKLTVYIELHILMDWLSSMDTSAGSNDCISDRTNQRELKYGVVTMSHSTVCEGPVFRDNPVHLGAEELVTGLDWWWRKEQWDEEWTERERRERET